jgi:hypothetical protein
MKMAVLWVVAPCRLVEVRSVAEVRTASIIRAISRNSETFLNYTSLHGATTQKTAMNQLKV